MRRQAVAQQEGKGGKAGAAFVRQPAASRSRRAGVHHLPAALLNLQRTHGNRFVQRLLGGAPVQRKCACGGKCDDCQARAATDVSESAARPLTPGAGARSLDPAARSFMEARFGEDFGGVRVHDNAQAAQTAQQLSADAFTIGRDIYFARGQYRPQTQEGRRLLAHELSHVVQQRGAAHAAHGVSRPGDPFEKAAEAASESVMSGRAVPDDLLRRASGPAAQPAIMRRLSSRTGCPANTNGAPADPVTDLAAIDAHAEELASLISLLFSLQATFTSAGFGNPASSFQQAYQNRFGLPPAVGAGFMNRLTGTVRRTQDAALAEEFEIMSRRFGLLERTFSQFVVYRCINNATTVDACAAANCPGIFAQSCAGRGVIFLCPTFWGQGANQQAAILIHEAAHMNIAEIGDTALRGPGRNFRFAECYASFVADIMGFTTPVDPCPPPP